MILSPLLFDQSPWLRGIDRLLAGAFDTQSLPDGIRLFQDDRGWTLEADLPGTSREALGLEAAEGELRLRLGDNRGFTLKLGPAVDATGITARFELGVLEVRLPRSAAPEARQISIS